MKRRGTTATDVRGPLLFVICASVCFGCVKRADTTTAVAAAKERPEEVALVDAFSELVGWIQQNTTSFDAADMPVCVVLGDSDDPSERTVALLRTKWRWVEPASACPFKDRNVLIVAADIGESLHDGRMLAHAGFSLGSHQGASWAYRLFNADGAWSIDAKLESRSVLP